MGRPKFPLYPSRYRHLLVEVPLSVNRGAELAPRLTVMSLAARANALARVGSAGADTPEGSFVGQVPTVNSYVDFSKAKFFCRNPAIFAESMCIRRSRSSVFVSAIPSTGSPISSRKKFRQGTLVFSGSLCIRRNRVHCQDLCGVSGGWQRNKIFAKMRDHFSEFDAHLITVEGME